MKPAHAKLVELLRSFFGADPFAEPEQGDVPWDSVIGLLRDQHLLATLAPAMADCDPPAALAQQVRQEVRALRLRTAAMLLELDRVFARLEEAGARPVVLKGGALAHTVYGDDARFFADLDILVDAARLEESYRALRHEGYDFAPTKRHPRYYEEYHYHRVLAKSHLVVEIHWDLSRSDGFCTFDLEGFRSRSTTIRTNGGALRVPSGPDQLLHAAAQSIREGFLDLRRVVDAGLLVRSGAADDPALVDLARQARLGTALWLLLRLTRLIGGVAAPEDLMSALGPGNARRAALRSLGLPTRLIRGEDADTYATRFLTRLLCAPSLADRRAEIWRFVVPSEYHFLDQGMDPEDLPGAGPRALFLFRRTAILGKLGSHLAWRLASGSRRESAPWVL